jgi:hypothetical protein
MDDDAKKIILSRRARFVAAALASLGAATHACGGKSVHNEGDGRTTTGGSTSVGGDGPNVCLSMPPSTGGLGGAMPCLSGGGTIGVGGTGPAGAGGIGGASVCLGMPLGGSGGAGGASAAGSGGVAAEGGESGEGGEPQGGAAGMPMPCLDPPA